jgi:lipopolysaccharide/colanic/teichoic acid biosynthesis glycosyltransferase
MIYAKVIKPTVDRLVAFVLIFGLLPVWVLSYFVIYLSQRSGVFFCQPRTGREMKRFVLYKIRTLEPSPTSDLSLSGRNYTAFGKWLRMFGLDELPQLVNILKGDMSFIGPRALPVEYECRYSENEKLRFKSRPGITGWAQVNGRNNTTWTRRFAADVWYVNNISFMLDCKIIWCTIGQLLKGGVEGESGMPVFLGSSSV